MDKRRIRLVSWVLLWVIGCTLWLFSREPEVRAQGGQWTIPDKPPALVNGGFECTNGFTKTKNAVDRDIWIPNGWTVVFAFGSPRLLSTRLSETDVCDPNSGGHVTRQEGIDSWYIPSQDIAAPPVPGKPFDLILYQQVPALIGGEYSLSAWMASECGTNNDRCPDGQYIAKTIGIDPNGGTDYTSRSIIWADDNRNDRHWQNVYTSVRALSNYITIYTRITSPFQRANNKGFLDAFSLVRAPLSAMNPLSPTIESTGVITLSWYGQQSADIEALPSGNYDLLFDVQSRLLPNGLWNDLLAGVTEQSSMVFEAPCLNNQYEFRVRARAEQPEGISGSSPNHRYPGEWSKPQLVYFSAPPTAPVTDTTEISPSLEITPSLYLPLTNFDSANRCN